jgi:hypothetical protein
MTKKSFLSKMFLGCLLILATTVMTSCSGGGIPNGRYAPVNEAVASGAIQAIVINGDNFTQVFPFTGQGISVKYKYTNGTITFHGGGQVGSVACEYRNDTLFYSGIPFVRKDY